MAKSRQVTIQFLGDAKGLVSAANSGSKATTTLGDKLKKVGKAAVIGFAGAAVVAGKAMYDMAEAAIEDEKSAALLANTLRNTTGATKAQVASVEDWISKQGELYGVTDDDLRPALAKLATATGDITKAQKLASLAMDVSAGTGKDLSSISLALAKAQNGSLAGLGRLGVATKDAAGETKTLAEITDDLSRKYAGSASKAAETASGKFQRLKVDLAETGEAIGYKLLPYADDLGSWLLKDGVPAVEGFAHSFKQELGPVLRDAKTWVSDNKDELHDLGAQVVDVVIPAIRDLGGFVGDAVRFFSALPGPIKSVGVEAGLAAVAIPKLSNAISGTTSAIGMSTDKLKGWRKGLLLAAGVGGIGAISEGARTGNKAVSLLGDAMTGAFVGGTLGSAIPGVGTAIGAVGGAAVGAGIGLFKMHRGADAAGDSSKDASPKVDGLKESLNQVTGAATRATKALILQGLEEAGLVTTAGQLGIATSDMIKASLGNNKAIDRVNSAWEKNGNILDGLQNQKITDWIYGMRTEMGKAEGDVKATNAALNGTDRASGKAGRALRDVGKERPQTDKWSALLIGDLNQAVGRTHSHADDMRSSLATTPGKARANMKPFASDLMAQLDAAVGRAHTAGVGIGAGIKSGVQGGLSGIATMAANAVHAAVAAAQAAVHSGGGGGGKGGGTKRTATGSTGNVLQGNFGGKAGYGQSLLDSYAGAGRKAEVAGNALLNGIVRGLKKGERTLKNVMQGLQSYIQTKTDKLNEILSDRSSFVESFRSAFSESIFSAQNTDADGNSIAPTLASMKAFAQQQQAQAHALAANIKSLLAKGLSRDMIQQLVSQGASGVQQIAALATGTAQDIADFNAVNQDINATLNGLGTDLYNALNPNAEAQIAALNAQIAQGERSIAALQAIADKLDKGDKIQIKGSDLVILLRAVERQTGQRLFVASA